MLVDVFGLDFPALALDLSVDTAMMRIEELPRRRAGAHLEEERPIEAHVGKVAGLAVAGVQSHVR